MSEWSTHNRSVVKTQLQQFLNEKRKKLVKELRNNADAMVMYIDRGFSPCPPYASTSAGNTQFPIWEGQMRDSTGVGLYVEGMTNYFMPVPKGRSPQSYKGDENIIGHERLEQAITQRSSFYPEGVWINLFSAVPYAEKINTLGSKWDRGKYYFKALTDTFTEMLLNTANYIKDA